MKAGELGEYIGEPVSSVYRFFKLGATGCERVDGGGESGGYRRGDSAEYTGDSGSSRFFKLGAEGGSHRLGELGEYAGDLGTPSPYLLLLIL